MEGLKGMNAAMKLFDSNRKEEKDKKDKPKITVSSETQERTRIGKTAGNSLFGNDFEDDDEHKEETKEK